MFRGKALSIFCIAHPQRGCFRLKSIEFRDHMQGSYCLLLSAGWGLSSHAPETWNRLKLSQKQSKDIGLDLYCCLSLPELTPRQLGHCSPSWYLYPSLHLPTETTCFEKHNHFLQPSPKKEPHWEIFLEVCLILGIGHCMLQSFIQFTAFSITVPTVNPTDFFL